MKADSSFVTNFAVVRAADIDDSDGDLVRLYLGAASIDEECQVVCSLVRKGQRRLLL